MTIRRYTASKDTTITNAFRQNLITRAIDSNMGESDVLEVFSIYGQNDSSHELSRILIHFPIEKIVEDRQTTLIPTSGSVQFILKLSNATHPFTLPKKYSLTINALSSSWQEGYGLDMETYEDIGYANWVSSSVTSSWVVEGGDIYENPEFSYYLEEGTEDLEVDITTLVEEWISNTKENFGIIVRLSSSLEDDTRSYYTKKFFGRNSQYFYKRPWIEARFDATVKDDRGKFFLYNPFVPTEQSYNNLYIYNRFKGNLVNIPAIEESGEVYVRLFENPNIFNEVGELLYQPLMLLNGENYSIGEKISTGIYKTSLGINTSLQKVYDVWFNSINTGSADAVGVGGEIKIINPDGEEDFSKESFIVNITNLKSSYTKEEKARFNVFVKSSNFNPNSYVDMTSTVTTILVDEMFYKIFRIVDNYEVIPYGTGDFKHTRLSFDKNTNYFEIDISLLEPGYSYGIKFKIFDTNGFYESKEMFKFRVEE